MKLFDQRETLVASSLEAVNDLQPLVAGSLEAFNHFQPFIADPLKLCVSFLQFGNERAFFMQSAARSTDAQRPDAMIATGAP
jgi:hypothetical protein